MASSRHLPFRSFDSGNLAVAIAMGACAGYVAVAGTFISHVWILDGHGRPIAEDFLAFWAAGKLALGGHAAAAYDTTLFHAAQTAVAGYNFDGFFNWSYPPSFFLAAAALASLPYVPAFLVWATVTLVAYAGVTAKIAKDSRCLLFACAAPWVFIALMPGQNGFLTASLAGAALLTLESRPVVAGLLIGLLSYKPQFVVLIPIAMASAGNWRSLAWAALSAAFINGLSCAIFGWGTAEAFVGAFSGTVQTHLVHGGVGWQKLQSVYGLSRSLGASARMAWLAQAAASFAIAAGVAVYWRSKAPFPLKAALLAASIPLATPYVFAYDLPVLSIPCAFLFLDRGFDRIEISLLSITPLLMFGVFYAQIPTALFASVTIALLVVRRAVRESRLSAPLAQPA